MSKIPKSGRLFVKMIIILILLFMENVSIFSQETENTDTTSVNLQSYRYDPEAGEMPGLQVSEDILDFDRSALLQFNDFGSFGSRLNGLKGMVKSGNYRFLSSYGYSNWDGYRAHDMEYLHNASVALGTAPSANTCLKILGSYINGLKKLPGSLTRSEFDQDPFRAAQRSVNRDEKNLSSTGRLNILYDAKFGRSLNNEIEISAFGTIGHFERATREYRIITRYELGLSARYSNTAHLGERTNEFSLGTGYSAQPQRTEYYDNLGGEKGDQVEQISAEGAGNAVFWFSDNFEILPDKLFILLTGRYDHVVYKVEEQTVPSRSQRRIFQSLTPKLTLTYDAIRWLALFASYGLGFESPADKQLESADPFYLYNPDLEAMRSQNIEAGVKFHMGKKDSASLFLRKFMIRAAYFGNFISNEMVPYEVFGDVYYRNAARSNRTGIDLECRLEILKDLILAGNYIYSQCTYKNYSAISVETDTTGNIVQVDRDFSGNKEPGYPVNNINLSLLYQHAISKKIGILAGLGYTGVSGLWADDQNTAKTGSFNLMNVNLGFDMKFGHFRINVSGGVNNIFNTVYTGLITANSADKRFYNAGTPRNYTGTLNIGYVF